MVPKHFTARSSIDWTWTEPMSEESLILVKRLLKLFPFETLRIEVAFGRRRDIFSDWDSYLDWFKAEPPHSERLFDQIWITRQKRMLGIMVWEERELAIYTEHDQSAPIAQACETMEGRQIRIASSKRSQSNRFQRFQEWAFSFFNSSVKRGTTSKRSPTIP